MRNMDWRTRISLILSAVSLTLTVVLVQQMSLPKPRPVKAQELYDVVNATMKAVRSADYEGAYQCAASVSQQKYTLTQFQQLFQTHYQSLVDAASVEFGGTQVRGRSAMVEVYAVALRGEVKHYRFLLVHEKTGWRVKEVVDVRTWPPGHRLAGLRT